MSSAPDDVASSAPAGASSSAPDGGALRATDLVKEYGKRRVVDGVSLVVRPGEVVGLLGPNGAGKTTTFYMIVGLLAPKSGRITLADRDMSPLPMYRRARLGIGYLAQEPSIFRRLTVRENVMAILETMPMNGKAREARCAQLLEDLAITHLRDRKGMNLSGGERRRTEIARCLVTDPAFILLDEPFVGIDPIAVHEIQQIILQLRGRGLGILITDHSVRETLRATDRVYLIYDGKILLSGSPESIAADEQARKLYLGENFRL